MEKILIKNSIVCRTCGDVLVSTHTHDFVRCSCEAVYLDGGNSYQRTGGDNYTDLSVYSDAPFETIRENLYRGTFGRDGDQPFKRVRLCDMDAEWLEAVITYEEIYRPDNPYLEFYRAEQKYRKEL